MLALSAAARDRVACFVVYIAEAHAEDGWQVAPNIAEGICIRQHTTLDERRAAARLCAADLGLAIPTLVDAPGEHAFPPLRRQAAMLAASAP